MTSTPSPTLEIVSHRPVRATPAGAFRAVATRRDDPMSLMLRSLLCAEATPILDERLVEAWGDGDLQAGLQLLQEAQAEGYVEGIDEPRRVPEGSLEDIVPPLLADLADRGEVLVSDDDGLALWSHGIAPELVGPIAALSADLASLHDRHAPTLAAAVGPDGGAWALVDGIGASHLGCWPLHVGERRFALVAMGVPRIHHPRFTELVWLLLHRYG